MIKIINLYDV